MEYFKFFKNSPRIVSKFSKSKNPFPSLEDWKKRRLQQAIRLASTYNVFVVHFERDQRPLTGRANSYDAYFQAQVLKAPLHLPGSVNGRAEATSYDTWHEVLSA